MLNVVNPGNNNDIKANLQTAIDNAYDGDTIILPIGTFKFIGSINTNKKISIKGAGLNNTILYIEVSTTDASLYASSMLTFDINSDSPCGIVISDLTLRSKDYNTGNALDRGIRINYAVDFVIKNCRFENFGDAGVQVYHKDAISRGLIYNCQFSHIYRPAIGNYGYGVDIYGQDLSWIASPGFGTSNFIFIEDNTFEYCRHPIAAGGCGRYVARHNIITNNFVDAAIDMHPGRNTGVGSGNQFATRVAEIYNNDINATRYNDPSVFGQLIEAGGSINNLMWDAIDIGGGESVIYDNSIKGFQKGIGVYTDSSYFEDITYPVHYQVGYTSGTAYGGSHTGTDTAHAEGDLFAWGNTFEKLPGSSFTDQADIVYNMNPEWTQLNRDYHFVIKPGYIPYTYPHPNR